ncbi:hypothetical protein [Marinobacter caseinilyticus]|uniref:hypothetical protein n=1 Tax=Marinobacter caseinilyticus TaxID=2692195 RepID=UPI00140E1500|nr:hypothetical protein [Marinobacter caseinilyticus]
MKRVIHGVKVALASLHPMPQNALTIRMPVVASREPTLRQVLADINDDPPDNPVMPFSVFSQLHFARFLLLDGPNDPETYGTTLIFMANVDGSATQFIDEMVQQVAHGLDQVLNACRGYPPRRKRTRASRRAYLRRHTIDSQAFYINTVGRSARQIRQEDELHQALQSFLSDLDAANIVTAQELRSIIIEYVSGNPELSWALTSPNRPSLIWRAVEDLRFATLMALGGLILFWGWPILLVWLLVLRGREFSDEEYTHRPALSRLNQLRATEDIAAHNPFAAVGYVKPGWLRRTNARALLAAAQATLRHVFNKGDLAGVPVLGLDGVDTIHFARWTLLDNDRRLLFTSNYDGSLESYMVDFIDKVAWGLNLIFSNGVGYPRTRWLVHEGARKEQRFKDYLGLHQIENQVWFTPYPHLTAVNIANNEAIREGLQGGMDEAQAQAWLRRL